MSVSPTARSDLVVALAELAGGSDNRRSAWLEPTVHALADLTVLEENWDAEGAPAIDPALIRAGARLLRSAMRADTPAPAVLPTNAGGVAFEWHVRDIDLEVEVVAPKRFHVYFADHRSDEEWSDDIGKVSSRLNPVIAELTDGVN